MIKKYLTGGFSTDLIREIEVDRETEKFVFTKRGREAKVSSFKIYHDTYTDALRHLYKKSNDMYEEANRMKSKADEFYKKLSELHS